MDESVARGVMPVSCSQQNGFKNIGFGTKLFLRYKCVLFLFFYWERKKLKTFFHMQAWTIISSVFILT